LLALSWYFAGNGKGEKDMVVLPYKDSLLLFSRYLQQLVMESLGKEKDLEGNTVYQGHCCLWQQRLNRPTRLCAAAAGRRPQFLPDIY
jgi:glucose-6-phosphate isomerase